MIDWSLMKTSEQKAEEERLARVPQSVSMRQARLAMLHAGILGDVEALIANMPGDEGSAARIDWEFAQEVRRDWHLVSTLGTQLGMTGAQIDDLFMFAGSITQ